MLRITVFLFLVASTASCHNCTCAPADGLRLGLISFDSADINTIVIRKFEKGGFNHMIDTSIFDNAINFFYPVNDTFQMAVIPQEMLLKSGFDYEINILSVSRTYRVTEMNEPQEGDCSGKVMCMNKIVSCKRDGNFVSTDDYRQTVYLKK